MRIAPCVVVTGMGARTALGRGVEALWEGALSGRSAIRPVTRFDTRRFHARHAALIEVEADDEDVAGLDRGIVQDEDGVYSLVASRVAADDSQDPRLQSLVDSVLGGPASP